MTTPELTELRLERKRRVLVCEFADGESFELDCEYLRTHSCRPKSVGTAFRSRSC